jgi:hypothetical protein
VRASSRHGGADLRLCRIEIIAAVQFPVQGDQRLLPDPLEQIVEAVDDEVAMLEGIGPVARPQHPAQIERGAARNAALQREAGLAEAR